MIPRLTRLSRHVIFWSLLAVAVGLTGLRVALVGLEHYQRELAAQISTLVGAPVSIGRFRAKLRGFTPELILDNITVAASTPGQSPAVALRQVRIGVNLLAMAANREVMSSAWVTLVGAKLSVQRQADGRIAIVGLKAGGGQPDWLWQGRRFELLQSDILWQGQLNSNQPLSLKGVDLVVFNRGQQHSIKLLAKLPAAYGQALTLVADFTGNPFASGSLNGTAYLAAKQLNAAAVPLRQWPQTQGLDIRAGQADIEIWGHIAQSRMMAVSGAVSAHKVQVQRDKQPIWKLTALHSTFAWQQEALAPVWRLEVPRLLLSHNEATLADVRFRLSGQSADAFAPQQLALVTRQLDIQPLLRTVQFFAPALAVQLPGTAQGTVDNVSLWVDVPTRAAAINADINHLGFAPVAALPGVENLSGHLHGTGQGGVLQLRTGDAQLLLPTLFRKALVIKRLDGSLAWQRQAGGLTLSSDRLALELLGVQTVNKLRLTLPEQVSALPFLDLQTALICTDASQLKHYFPVGVMKPSDIVWLDGAFVQGQIPEGKLVYVGYLGQALANPIQDFEVKDTAVAASDEPPRSTDTVIASEPLGGGFFEALMEVRHLQLNYAPGWPQLTDVNGQLRFLQNRLVVHGDEGHSQQLKASQVTVINPAVGVSDHLLVQGLVNGKIADALAFLKASPLQSRIGAVADAISTQGDTEVSLDLSIPLALGAQPKVDGKATLNNARLKIVALDLPMQHINGLLKFNEQGVYSDTIKAETLNYPVAVTVSSNHGQTTLMAAGHTELGDLEAQFGLPHTAYADGGLDYQLVFPLPLDKQPSEITINSDLLGVEVKLPGLLAKPRREKQAFSIVFGLGNPQTLPITLNYADTLKAALRFDSAQQRVVSGHLILGAGSAVLPDATAHGLSIGINRPTVDLQAMLGGLAGSSGQNQGLAVQSVHLHTDNATWAQAPLGGVDLRLQAQPQHWQGQIDSAFAVGTLTVPLAVTPVSTVTLALEQLDLAVIKKLQGTERPSHIAAATASAADSAPAPQTLPLLSLHSHKTRWEAADLGSLDIRTERLADGIALTALTLGNAAQTLKLSGEWTVRDGRQQTQLHGHLDLPNAGRTLAELDLTHDLVGSHATADFTGHWRGAPHQFSLAALQGSLDVYANEGRILSIEPGLGRVLGILAIDQWAKRLQLDFRDLYEEGLMFNFSKGHFQIADGKAVTHDLLMDAIPARISLSGSTDFVNKTLDIQASVIPKSADALPIAGTIVDKFTSLVAHTLTGSDQDGFLLGSQYQLVGQWGVLQVVPEHESDGVVPKLWSGLTDFSWLDDGKRH